MPRYLAATHDDDGTIHPLGPIDADDALKAVLAAQEKHGPCGVMPPKAVRVWMRDARRNEARQRSVTAIPDLWPDDLFAPDGTVMPKEPVDG